MDDHGYYRACVEYESRLFDGPPPSMEELEEEIEEKEYWNDFYADLKFEQERIKNHEYR